MKKHEKLIMGTIIGGAIGSVLGLLFAPKSGKEMRRDIKDKSKVVYDKGKKIHGKIVEEHGEKIEGSKSFFKKLFSKPKKKEKK